MHLCKKSKKRGIPKRSVSSGSALFAMLSIFLMDNTKSYITKIQQQKILAELFK